MSSTLFRTARQIQRWFSPVFDLRNFISSIWALTRYPIFFIKYLTYRRKSSERVPFFEIYPCLDDQTNKSQSGRGHYFYQDIWALARVLERKPNSHVDIGSRIDGFAGQLSAFCTVEYVDIRSVELGLERFTMREGSLLCLPYKDKTVESLSCLHVIEHVGMGRYGDPIDPNGSVKSARELARVLKRGGQLILGVPIGQERVAFNAHRILSPLTIIEWFFELQLVEFSVVADDGKFTRFENPKNYLMADYACGLFLFRRD